MPVSPKIIAKPKNMSAPPKIATRDLLNTIFYYRWTATAVIAAFFVLGIVVAVLVPAAYRSEARLLTLYAGYYDMQLDQSGTKTAPRLEATEIVNVEAQILSSPELHRAVVQQDIGAGADQGVLEEAYRRFETKLTIEKVAEANTIALSYSDSNPEHAAHILDTLIAEYFRQRAGVFTQGRVAFLVDHRDKVRAQLDKANAELIAFQRAHDVVNIDAQINGAVTLHSLLLQRKLEGESALVQDSATLESLVKEAKSVPATIQLYEDNTEAAHVLDTMQLSLLQLQSRRADLASRYMEDSPFVLQINEQIADVQKAIEQQKSSVISSVRVGHNSYFDTVHDRVIRLTSDIAGEKSRQDTLEQQIKDSDDHIQFLIATANQLHRIEIDRDLLADSFRNSARQVEQARIEQNQVDTSSSTNVRIIQAPFPPDRRSNPPSLFIAAALVIGILTAIVSIIVRASLRETFLSPEEIERSLGLQVLSAPINPKPPEPPLIRLLGDRLGPLLRRAVRPSASGLTPPPMGPKRPRAEYGRMVAAINHVSDVPSKVVLMLAFRDDDGLDATAEGLIEELERRSTHPVLVLDLTTDGQLYGAPDADGLLHLPGDDGPAPSWRGVTDRPGSHPDAQSIFDFHAVERQHLVVGRIKTGAFLPVGRQSAGLFDLLRQSHDYVVIRVSAASRSFTGVEMAIVADATILAIRAESTRKPVALALKSQILDAGGTLVGVAMTHRFSYIPSFVYRFL